ncbi:MAG: DUF1073 domain-containing protein, partial [Neorhizobium sp.]|nr:DUF1073 domain-containing protein [Neorhizobium sp.]
KLQAKGEEDKTDKIKQIEDVMNALNVMGAFQECAEHDGFFGRGHLYIDLGSPEDEDELKTPIGNGRNSASKAKVKKWVLPLARLGTVEPMWCYPQGYNTTNPLSPHWYKPSHWYVMGKQVHTSRLLTFVGREVPDMLKPSYSFGGLSMTQIARPYVENWLQTRQAVANIVTKFSTNVLKTDLALKASAGGNDTSLFNRVELFNIFKTNDGLLLVDKETEDFENVSAPLSGLDALQAQSQEQMASVSGIPIVVLLGIQPAGLNASSQGEIETYHKWIHSNQERIFRPNLEKVIDFIQLSEFGEVDPDIVFKFELLGELTEKEVAEVQNIRAQTDVIYTENGILSEEEVRKRIANDEDSPYQGIDVEDVPDPPPPEDTEGDDDHQPVTQGEVKVDAA